MSCTNLLLPYIIEDSAPTQALDGLLHNQWGYLDTMERLIQYRFTSTSSNNTYFTFYASYLTLLFSFFLWCSPSVWYWKLDILWALHSVAFRCRETWTGCDQGKPQYNLLCGEVVRMKYVRLVTLKHLIQQTLTMLLKYETMHRSLIYTKHAFLVFCLQNHTIHVILLSCQYLNISRPFGLELS